MDINNALSAKNIRTHGMRSAKWTTRDKIIQYKGLVNLYKRDREIQQADTAVASKRQQKELLLLRKAIDTDRGNLDNAIAGDKQQLRNTLAEHREMQLAYQHSDPKKVIEILHQLSFTKRKVLDKLRYQMNLKSQDLIKLKMEEALLEDRLKYEHFGQTQQEKDAQIITGKVQDALLRKEAALSIQQTYEKIIDIMKRDALYFDSILKTIQNDYYNQCRCVLNATKQGQLATEYKNDREEEFATLENCVITGMKMQRHDLETVREQVDNAASNLKNLLRRDSDLTLCEIKLEESRDVQQLKDDVSKIEETLTTLKNATLVSSFKNIYPCLQEQVRQKKRLTILTKKCERNRDIIMNKLNHAETMNNMLKNTMVDTTTEYKKKKKELLAAIEDEIEKKKETDTKIKYKHNLIAKVRLSLRQLQQMCKPLKKDSQPIEVVKTGSGSESEKPKPVEPDVDEIDGNKIIVSLTTELTHLMNNTPEKLEESRMDEAYRFYEMMMVEKVVPLEEDIITRDTSLLEGLVTEVSHLLTREDIKRISAEIVAENSRDEDMIMVLPTKKKKFKF